MEKKAAERRWKFVVFDHVRSKVDPRQRGVIQRFFPGTDFAEVRWSNGWLETLKQGELRLESRHA